MKRYAALLFVVVWLVGCRAPTPSLNNVWAPYGSTRIAPPATGSYGRADAYYQRSSEISPPRVGAQTDETKDTSVLANSQQPIGQDRVPTASSPKLGGPDTMAVTRSSATNHDWVVSTGYLERAQDRAKKDSPATARTNEPPIRIVEPSASVATAATGASVGQGGGVSGSRALAEPALFVPPDDVIEITQLPAPKRPPRTVASLGSGVATSARRLAASGWRSRYTRHETP